MEQDKKTILMIEDDTFVRGLYKDRLEKEGFNFIESNNGIQGMNKIANEKPDLVILDLLLPLKTGFDILEEMNENKSILKIPVIILTTLKQNRDIEEARHLGAEDYFIKSESNFSDIIKKVKEVLS